MAQASERQITKSGRSFDSLAYAKSMESVGFTRQQAEMMAEKQGELIDDRLATKEDLEKVRLILTTDVESLRISTKADIDSLRVSVKADMSELKAEILKWMFGAIGVQTIVLLGALLGLLRGFVHG